MTSDGTMKINAVTSTPCCRQEFREGTVSGILSRDFAANFVFSPSVRQSKS